MAQQISIPLIQGAQSANNVGDAFDSRTAQLEQERAQKEKQQDADFHTVVKYASDGLTNEARYFAQQKGINVPDEVFKNGDFAKGLSIAGDLYDDPATAQKFTTAYMSTQGDAMSRYSAGLGAAGKPMSKSDRELALYAKKLQMQQQYGGGADKGFSLSAGETRYDSNGNVIAASPKQDDGAYEAGVKAVNAYLSGGVGVTDDGMQKVYDAAVSRYKDMHPQQATSAAPPQSTNPYAGRGNPAVTTPYQNIQPVIMDGSGNMSATQQGQGRLTPPPAPQAQQQTQSSTVIPQDYKLIGKTPEGYNLYQAPDGEQYADKPMIQSGSVQMNNTVTDELSSPALVRYEPQDQIPRSPVMKLSPVETQNGVVNPIDYASVPQRGSMVDYAKTGLYNVTNIPAHLDRIGRASAGLLSGVQDAGQGAMQGVDNLIDGVGNYINRPSQVIVYDRQGNAFYVPVEHLQEAVNRGYSRSIDNGPNVPISQ